MLPNLIIIGAMKCATTSLHYYLNLHPEILMSPEKELNFFVLERNWRKGIKWYKSNFTGKARVYGESSPNYTMYPFFDGVPERIYSVAPDARLIYIFRDPIERIISHYMHFYCSGTEDRKISEAVTDHRSNPYICRSKYYMQLEQYLRYFPRSHILIITAEELYYNRVKTLQKVFNFLGVDDSFYSHRFSFIWHRSDYKRRRARSDVRLERLGIMNMIKLLPFEMRGVVEKLLYLPFSHKVKRPALNERVRQELMEFLKDDTDRLREYTGCDFKGWCV